MTNRTGLLSYPVRLWVLATFLGQLLLLLGALTLVPLAVSLVAGDHGVALRYLLVVGFCGGLGWWLARGDVPRAIQTNEAMVLAAAMFVISPLLMTIPLTGAGLGFIDALFEAVSGVTTTGLSTLASLEGMPTTFIFARAWMQWYGGLGIVVLALALMVPPGAAARRLSSNSGDEEELVPGTRLRARRLIVILGVMTLAGIAMLWLSGMDPLGAVTHTLAAVSTGGFAPADASLAGLPRLLQAEVSLLCLVGAVPLSLYYLLWLHPRRARPQALQAAALVGLGLLAALALTAALAPAGSPIADWPWWDGAIMAFSAQTTAGFSSLSPGEMAPAPQLILIAAMFVGGGVGSTAGGVKVLRLLIVARFCLAVLSQTALARHAVDRPGLWGLKLEEGVIREALFMVVLYLVLIAASWLPFLALGHDPMAALFEVVSAAGTVGLSSGITGPDLEPGLKLLLCLDMLLGRVELVALLVLLYPRTWWGERMQKK